MGSANLSPSACASFWAAWGWGFTMLTSWARADRQAVRAGAGSARTYGLRSPLLATERTTLGSSGSLGVGEGVQGEPRHSTKQAEAKAGAPHRADPQGEYGWELLLRRGQWSAVWNLLWDLAPQPCASQAVCLRKALSLFKSQFQTL